ncbi:LPS export ABC transporter periplasmic protein LptC [Enterovirga rhinocerotis]|uniref:LPS export ABC transporter periplasmic protein LptC n=1 Tax=Enterovirga rhinocerotis TaxID=1339210 RepID=UPI00105FFDD4|nr:LPS export ABC transporter periplasmic protein LptC [Enterovirga rhinocerotis]
MALASLPGASNFPAGLPAPRRSRTFAAARRHSRFVRFLKFVIPVGSLIAVAAVAAVSLFNPLGRIPGLTVGPISFSGSKIAMEAPRLTGFRKDNKPYEVTAQVAYQDIRKPNVIELKDMKAKLAVDSSGGIANLVAKTGIFDTGKEHLDLKDDIKIWTAKGETVLLKTASVDFKTGSGVSRDPVQIDTPTLSLQADGMEIAENGQRITFTGRVRTTLVRAPEARKSGAAQPGPAGAPAKFSQAETGDRR